jgi:hypothetical protein
MFGFDIGAIAKGVMEGFVGPLFSFLNKKEDVALEKFRVDGQVDMALVNAHVALGVAKINLLKNQWIVALQVGFGFPLMIYYGKCILWDKVLGSITHGHTDALDGDIQQYSLWIVGFLFAHSVLDSWARKT